MEAGLMKKIILSMEAGLLDYLMILSVPFCPYHFAPYHFVLEPIKAITAGAGCSGTGRLGIERLDAGVWVSGSLGVGQSLNPISISAKNYFLSIQLLFEQASFSST